MSVPQRNPFRPSFGTTPPVLAGRAVIADLFGDALDAGPGAPGRATLYTGARGVGKTVMLNEAEVQARERGWVVISETATRGLAHRLLTDHLPSLARLLGLSDTGGHITGVTLPMNLGGLTRTAGEPARPESLRQWIAAITDHLDANDTGLLITVDEVHGGDRSDLRELGAIIQHAFREERPLAFAAAGLPSAVNDLLSDDVLTFLRRAERFHLGPVDMPDASEALERPIMAAGRGINESALVDATAATGGYPFLIQLVGFHLWNTTDAPTFTRDDVATAVAAARSRLGSLVYEAALRDLSPMDRAFLYAMTLDGGRASQMADIAARLNRSSSYASQYRLRLIGTDLIRDDGHGRVAFAMPYLRDYLIDNEGRWNV
jgi:hypothetical protein